MDREQIITFYRDQGIPVFGLSGNTKRPGSDMKEWQKIELDDTRAYQHQGNLAANIPPDILVIDVDPRNFPKDENGKAINTSVKFFRDLGLPRQDTMKVKTGGGGLHLYFRKPTNVSVLNNLSKKGYPGIDIKSNNNGKGAYVVIPSSTHPETNESYVFKTNGNGTPHGIMDLPDNILDFIKRPNNGNITAPVLAEPVNDVYSALKLFTDYLIKDAPVAVQGNSGDHETFAVACYGKDFGLDEDNTYNCMRDHWNERCIPPWDENALRAKVANAFSYSSSPKGSKNPQNIFDDIEPPEKKEQGPAWDLDAKRIPKKTLINTVNYFLLPGSELNQILRFNEFTRAIEVVKKPPWRGSFITNQWGDEDTTACKFFLASAHGFEISKAIIEEAIVVVAMKNRVHPVKDYLEGLTWDRKPRLDTWLYSYAGVEKGDYSAAVGSKTLVGAVSRIMNPGSKFDYVLVLEGRQGTGKSTICDILGGEWYAELNIDPKNKEAIHSITGKWIVELSEMEITKKADADAMKAFISKRHDRIRFPFEKHAIDVSRQCIFIGTINPESGVPYLKDETANRRFWPVKTSTIRTHILEKVRDQLWAEAVYRYKNGETSYLDNRKLQEEALRQSDRRAVGDPWSSKIAQTLDAQPYKTVWEVSEIWEKALRGRITDFNLTKKARIQKAMRFLGWVQNVDGGSIKFTNPKSIDISGVEL